MKVSLLAAGSSDLLFSHWCCRLVSVSEGKEVSCSLHFEETWTSSGFFFLMSVISQVAQDKCCNVLLNRATGQLQLRRSKRLAINHYVGGSTPSWCYPHTEESLTKTLNLKLFPKKWADETVSFSELSACGSQMPWPQAELLHFSLQGRSICTKLCIGPFSGCGDISAGAWRDSLTFREASTSVDNFSSQWFSSCCSLVWTTVVNPHCAWRAFCSAVIMHSGKCRTLG